MKPKARSTEIQVVRELLGLAVIGFVLWLAAIGWLPVPSANAAPGAPRHGDPEESLARMQAQLNLTDDQVEQIRPILQNQSARRRALLERFYGKENGRMRVEMQKLWEVTRSDLAAVLTADQMAKWQQLREEHRIKRLKRHSAPTPQ